MSNYDLNDRVLPTHVACIPVERMDLQENLRSPEIQFVRSVSYINGLVKDVNVTDHLGMPLTISSTSDTTARVDTFEVIVTYRFIHGVNFDPLRLLTDEMINERKELKIVRDRLLEFYSDHRRRMRALTLNLCYHFDMEMFKANNMNLYSPDLNLTLGIGGKAQILTHPSSEEGKLLSIQMGAKAYDIRILINDPLGEFGERFINIGGEVFRIPVSNDPSRPKGVHLSGSVPVRNESYGEVMRSKYVSFAEALELNFLYMSVAEAQAHGDSSSREKREYEQLKDQLKLQALERETALSEQEDRRKAVEHELKLSESRHKQEIMLLQHRMEQENLTAKQATLELDAKRAREKALLDEEAMIRQRILSEEKYHQDRAKANSGAILDILKWLPVAISGIIGVITLAIKVGK